MVVMTSLIAATPPRRSAGAMDPVRWFDVGRHGALEARSFTLNLVTPTWFPEELTVTTELLRL